MEELNNSSDIVEDDQAKHLIIKTKYSANGFMVALSGSAINFHFSFPFDLASRHSLFSGHTDTKK